MHRRDTAARLPERIVKIPPFFPVDLVVPVLVRLVEKICLQLIVRELDVPARREVLRLSIGKRPEVLQLVELACRELVKGDLTVIILVQTAELLLGRALLLLG